MRKIVSFFVLCVTVMFSFAQQAPARIRFDHLGVADGLPENSVRCMLQDHLGFMWLGTQLGLARYDGYKMTSFSNGRGDPRSFKGKQVGALVEDKNGNIWVGAESLSCFDRASQRFIEYPDKNSGGFGHEYISFIHLDKKGFIWTVREIKEQYILSRFDPKTNSWVYFSNDPNKPFYLAGDDFNGLAFAEDKDGNIWTITTTQSQITLLLLDRSKDKFIPYSSKQYNAAARGFKHLRAIAADDQGMLYLTTLYSGLFLLNTHTNEIKQFRHDPKDPASLLNDTTFLSYPDKMGYVWINTYRGLDRFDPKKNVFDHYISKPDDPSTPGAGWLRVCYDTPAGDIWFETFSPATMNLYQRRTNSFTRYVIDDKQEDALWGFTASAFVDNSGMAWIGSYVFGLNKESRISQFSLLKNIPGNNNSLQDDNVTSVCEAASEPGVIWFGTDNGLDRYDKKTGEYTHYKHDDRNANSITKGTTYAMAEDKKGRFWVGTSKGLNLMDRKKRRFLHFVYDSTNANSLCNNMVTALKAVSDGTLWIGTNKGLDHFDYDNNKFTHYQIADSGYTPVLFDLISRYTTPDRKVAAILHPGDSVNATVSFALTAPADLLITGLGEININSNYDHGWIEDAKGKINWDMDFSNTVSDGSLGRIRAGVLHLNVGTYRLRYKSDEAYSYGDWFKPPPLHPDLWEYR